MSERVSTTHAESNQRAARASTSPGLLVELWSAFASPRTTAVLAILFSCAAFISVLVPQGQEAVGLARDASATQLHRLAAWGLTDVFASSWFLAVAVLLAGNLTAIAAQAFLGDRSAQKIAVEPPQRAPHQRDLSTRYPEVAFELIRSFFTSRLGPPRAEAARGPRALMVFDSGSSVAIAPLASHVGLLILVLGAGLLATGATTDAGVARARLAITDTRTHTTGHFDMVAGEPVQLFQSQATYTLREYQPSQAGLGPAVRMERSAGEGGGASFWVYLNAPRGFDERHRASEVAIEAEWMGLSPPPGEGPSSSPLGVLLVLGFGLIAFGSLFAQRSRGRIWVDAEGDAVRLAAVPYGLGDRHFAVDFERWAKAAQRALDES